MSKKLLEKKNFRSLGIVVLLAGAVFAATMAFLVTGTALFVSLAVGITLTAAGGIIIVVAYSVLPGELPKPDYRETTRKVTLTAVLLGLAALTKLFSLNILIFGGSGMRIGLAGIFTTFPAILFGPIYGGMASAASDILGCIISPIGAYNPLYTLTAFAGGFIKGLIWLALKRSKPKNLRIAFTACFAVLAILGTAFYISFASDGIKGGIIAKAEEMPSKGYVQNRDNSFLTDLIVKRVKSTDTYTITSVADGEVIYLPGTATVDGASVKVALGSTAFDDYDSVKEIYIPDALSSFNANSLKDKDVTIYLTEKCTCLDAVMASGLNYVLTETVTAKKAIMRSDDTVFDEFTFSSNYNYGKNLAGYVNYVAFGITLVGLFGLVMVLAEYLWSRSRKERRGETSGVRIFAAIFAAEIVQTTINTVILKEMTYQSAWASYPFMIVWIPRAAEGLIICLIQAYFITLLYSLLKGRFGSLKMPQS
ncbi:MAG: folate family ECF transporter S component [Eubacteriales bacterium]|nr:folate family ECF transporter S component [Eubacteriales bacterium]